VNEYRKRFIQLNLALVGAMLLLMLLTIGGYMAVDYYDGLRNAMKQVVQSLKPDALDKLRESAPPSPQAQKEYRPRGQRLNMADRKAITAILYREIDQSFEIVTRNTELEEDLLLGILQKIVRQKDNYGVLLGDGVVYYHAGNREARRIAIAPTGYLTDSMWKLAGTLALVWSAAMLGFFALSNYLSGLAVKPMEEAIAREKQFIADASHDLKTPLAVILANNSILRESGGPGIASQMKWIDSTEAAAKNMQRLIQEMLLLSALEQQTPETDCPPVSFSSIMLKAALQMESVAYEKGILLENIIGENITLRGSGEHLRRITESLIENAIKYEPEGGKVSVSLTRRKRRVRLLVHNHHSVVAAEDLPHLFERFYRGDKSRRTHDSHGLGLAITKQLVENLGGKIHVKSSPAEGTVFTVEFSHRAIV